jgi:hypothetical protein
MAMQPVTLAGVILGPFIKWIFVFIQCIFNTPTLQSDVTDRVMSPTFRDTSLATGVLYRNDNF